MRELFVSELAKELLGPRNGPYEELPLKHNPRDEYLLGVLSPSQTKLARDPDVEAELESPVDLQAEEDSTDKDVFPVDLLAPTLNPKALPRSIGISFAVESANEKPEFLVCLTWARYDLENEKWKRKPRYFTCEIFETKDPPPIFIDSTGHAVAKTDAEISFRLKVRRIQSKLFQVTAYLMNEINAKDEHAETEEHVFQPQIRITCKQNTKVVPVPKQGASMNDELELIYDDKPVLARGFICSATWRSIDPERPEPNGKNYEEIPFFWKDGLIIPENRRKLFNPPDLRSEFLPLYSVEAPEFKWTLNNNKPELSADSLSELTAKEQVNTAFDPLIKGYSEWISKQEAKIGLMENKRKEVYSKNIETCKQILKRINEGVEFLRGDDDARLAFAFANKSIALQNSWAGKASLNWHPFQIAFILLALESAGNRSSNGRDICDLLWIPTGGGKTETYLAISAFTIAYRRRKALQSPRGDKTGAGVTVMSRYTLRLLTIQQFRRTVRMITAMEFLRVLGHGTENPIGWRPKHSSIKDEFIWGTSRFSIGLWVGGNVTPNNLMSAGWGARIVPGAFDILKGEQGEGDPAQILNCPACDAMLTIPDKGLPPGKHTLHHIVESNMSLDKESINSAIITQKVPVTSINITSHPDKKFSTVSIEVNLTETMTAQTIDTLWEKIIEQSKTKGIELSICSTSVRRPGYFLVFYSKSGGKRAPKNFEIFCPNPACTLNQSWWSEGVPLVVPLSSTEIPTDGRMVKSPDGLQFNPVPECFRSKANTHLISSRIPIPAQTVDEQIYHNPPSFLVATVDKFARLPFEPRCSAIFGNLAFYDARFGFYRTCQHSSLIGSEKKKLEHPRSTRLTKKFQQSLSIPVSGFDPPDLIIQDELHLIEGPLGSMVGIYETAIDRLCSSKGWKPKYVASTATVRQAADQVQSLFCRNLLMFPQPVLTAGDSFFATTRDSHPLQESHPGRLYLGICAPGKGPLTPTYKIWARLLRTGQLISANNQENIDPFWTLTGYFNAVKELAGAKALYRQDIPDRLKFIAEGVTRELSEENAVELSSRTKSTELPAILDSLNISYPYAKDALFTTSMFGTGIDISRIGLMMVHGQPKSCASYIQATGRVGRQRGALVVTFYRSTRPRDLNHYEFFCGYHQALQRSVEPVTVSPFAPGALAKAIGPISVALLRNEPNAGDWYRDDSASKMSTLRNTPEVKSIPTIIENRASLQPLIRRPNIQELKRLIESQLDRWQQLARLNSDLKYVEYYEADYPVVLGDPQHEQKDRTMIYENVPQSLREIEETTGFQEENR